MIKWLKQHLIFAVVGHDKANNNLLRLTGNAVVVRNNEQVPRTQQITDIQEIIEIFNWNRNRSSKRKEKTTTFASGALVLILVHLNFRVWRSVQTSSSQIAILEVEESFWKDKYHFMKRITTNLTVAYSELHLVSIWVK